MFDRLQELYKLKKITATQLDEAVKKGWITKKQKDAITKV